MASKTNRVEVPEAKAAMDRFKTEVASELGVNLKEGYNGDLTSKEAGRADEISSAGIDRTQKKLYRDILCTASYCVSIFGESRASPCFALSNRYRHSHSGLSPYLLMSVCPSNA